MKSYKLIFNRFFNALLFSLIISNCSGLPDKAIFKKTSGLPNENQKKNELVFVYVHGFGEGGKKTIPFAHALDKFIKSKKVNAKVLTHKWDNHKLNFLKILPQWLKTRKLADAAGQSFHKDVLLPLEASGTPYYLIGYSLGSRVIAASLKCGNEKLNHLRGIYFLGSALNHEYRIELKNLPSGLKINNYYSPLFDQVLKTSFHVMEGTNAAGEVGFDDEAAVNNYRTVCTHAYKGGFLRRDYSDIAPALASLALFNENIIFKGESTSFNIEMSVMKGTLHWNNIVRFKHGQGVILIQHNANTNWFRTGYIDENGKRKRKAWSRNMQSLLKTLKKK